MQSLKKHYLIIEPYYGGSHKIFIQGLQKELRDQDFTLLTLPARKWKMRMQLAAPWMAEQIIGFIQNGYRFDGILTSTFIDVAVLRSLLAGRGILLPVAIYFHENQFAYPSRPQDQARFQFTAINFTSALCADSLAFNSEYNRSTFLSGIRRYLKKAADVNLHHLVNDLFEKSTVISPGMDFSPIDALGQGTDRPTSPVVVWNHRWEHDKNPNSFFSTLFELSEQGADFQLLVLGETFQDSPEIFDKAKTRLAKHLLHFGYVPDRTRYYKMLQRGTIVVSTAIHEFFGMSVLEAVRAGCVPLVPDRLAYQELFPVEFRYKKNQLKKRLGDLIDRNEQMSQEKSQALTTPHSWKTVGAEYVHWLSALRKEERS
ncbi:DUF3524 domain-containing protein [Desulfogranum marinum]|uniref:tRNA-queuosine alpha-mannosyltransferase domain-containing protein n=1 Tax=Desulfogranum marinum TaxID=453220 RepID=UPI0029C88DE8|nr:DUF3524 domain-containing protein [Desulfogranum marinum]